MKQIADKPKTAVSGITNNLQRAGHTTHQQDVSEGQIEFCTELQRSATKVLDLKLKVLDPNDPNHVNTMPTHFISKKKTEERTPPPTHN